MKKLSILFAAATLVAGVAVMSCTKESTTTPQAVTTATDAIAVDNVAANISGTIEDYEFVNQTTLNSLAMKSMSADPTPIALKSNRWDSCATVTFTKTPTLTAGVVTGATVSLKIDFGTIGCKDKDGNLRIGTITSNYTWIKGSGWRRVSEINLTVNDVLYAGRQVTTQGVTGQFNHAYYTDSTTMKITAKDGSWKNWTSNRQRELLEGNNNVNPVKEWKIQGNSVYTNSAGQTSTYTITVPLIKFSNCKTYSAGTVTTTNTAGVTTTIDYGTGTDCKTGYTVKFPGDKDGKGAFTRFIKIGK